MKRAGNHSQGRDTQDQSQKVWVIHTDKQVFFSQKPGCESMDFLDRDEMMVFVKDCVEKGYKVG